MAKFDMDAADLDRLEQAARQYAGNAEAAINEVLHGEGGQLIMDRILPRVPRSGRTWRGKAAPAASAQPFTQEAGNLSVTVKTKNKYHYLYFPDDGSNTVHHAGNQQFMLGGGEAAAPDIIDRCIEKLIEI